MAACIKRRLAHYRSVWYFASFSYIALALKRMFRNEDLFSKVRQRLLVSYFGRDKLQI